MPVYEEKPAFHIGDRSIPLSPTNGTVHVEVSGGLIMLSNTSALLARLSPAECKALENQLQSILSGWAERKNPAEKPFTCCDCGKKLAFSEMLYHGKATYCFDHVPDYDKHQQW